MKIHPSLSTLRGGLVVSCQADPGNPLNFPEIMAAMAEVAVLGGAVAIRANGVEDIKAIKQKVSKPVIGIYKFDIPGFEVRITPTVELAIKVSEAGADMIAVDATKRKRPDDFTLQEVVASIKKATGGKAILGDVSTFDEGIAAQEAGFDAVLTTLSGYTDYSRKHSGPDFDLIERLAKVLDVPLIAEGKISTPEEAKRALELGAYAVVVGSAITRPQLITESFVQCISQKR